MIKALMIALFYLTSLNTVFENNQLNKPNSICQYPSQTISAIFGNANNINRLGGKDNAWQIKFCSDGTIVKHGWREAGGLHRKVDGSDTYEYGRYVITKSTSSRKDITIIWSNGREEKCYITYYSSYLKLSYNMHTYDEF